nr:hypothetical protein B11C_110011 [Bartonella sp. 1-1C]
MLYFSFFMQSCYQRLPSCILNRLDLINPTPQKSTYQFDSRDITIKHIKLKIFYTIILRLNLILHLPYNNPFKNHRFLPHV